MNGRDVLWQPGTDHAGIATQMVVERKLMERQEPDRRTLGREAFVERVWAWKAESGGAIVAQLKRLGASCDWSRERFTLDEGLSRAVAKVFVQLYRDGLIYKDKRLVNWDPKFQTAISDLEVVQVECRGSFKWSRDDGEPLNAAALAKVLAKNPNGHLYYFDYPVVDASGEETGERIDSRDHAARDHARRHRGRGPSRRRALSRHLVGRRGPPAAGRPADRRSSPTTIPIPRRAPARSRSPPPTTSTISRSASATRPRARGRSTSSTREARVFLKDNLAFFEGLESDHDHARLMAAVDGQDRFVARLRIVEMMALAGLLAKIEPHAHMVPHGDRSNAVIEPWLTDQWYVDAKTLAEPALAAVRDGRTQFVPKTWEKTYFEWLENIQPWCVSRQLWWGHQIPAWYSPWGGCYVEETDEAAYRRGARRRRRARRADRSRGRSAGARSGEARGDLHARRGRARHLVFVGAVAVLDARLAGRDAGAQTLLPDRRAGHRLRHHLLLGRPDDDDGAALPAGRSRSATSTSTPSSATRRAPRCRSRRAT